ncbi:TIR domain-containing protein [Arthrobacter sp. U41]|uniref:TIR domain-containing protein n=1 Tax=Arthrobacter sp. U41 TaxID=1849032 RepID=UPI0011A197A4|nr:nucleotide-binding protein [Arthrobacter sp. U41]
MELEKTFTRTRFASGVISHALEELEKLGAEAEALARAEHESKQVGEEFPMTYQPGYCHSSFRTGHGNESWEFDSIDEWYASYDRGAETADLTVGQSRFSLRVGHASWGTVVSVTAPSNDKVARLMRFFDLAEADSKLPEVAIPEPPRLPVVVFMGHGRSLDWRDIKDHLRDSHHYTIEAYEVGARAGHSIRDVLDSMLAASSFALLIMTGEDETSDGDARARQNVVHEAGLFQGKLGFNRAIAVVENGVEVFSNLDGVQQIRYDKGNVKSTFGEILATLRREFGDRR